MNKSPFIGKLSLVTGAGSGIGQALAQEICSLGGEVIALDVDPQGLKTTRTLVHSPLLSTKILDVCSEKDWQDLAQELQGREIHFLFNNAGRTLKASIENTGPKEIETLFSVNFWGTVHGTRAFLPFLKSTRGQFINISSLYGLHGFAHHSAYCASKAAVKAYSETLRQEMAPLGVGVTVVFPGGVKTSIARNALLAPGETYHPQSIQSFEDAAPTSPKDAALSILKAAILRKPQLILGKDARLVHFLQKFFPRTMDPLGLKLAQRINQG